MPYQTYCFRVTGFRAFRFFIALARVDCGSCLPVAGRRTPDFLPHFQFGRIIILAVASFLCAFPGIAMGAVSSAKLLAQHSREVGMVNNYLLEADTVVADFTQVSGRSGVSKGKIYIDRNRQYLIIDYRSGDVSMAFFSLRGRNSYLDKETREIFYLPMQNLVAKALLATSISDGKFLFEDIKRIGDYADFVFRFAQDPAEGKITLRFDTKIGKFASVEVSGQDVETVKVSIDGSQEHVKISKEFFEVPLFFGKSKGSGRKLTLEQEKILEQAGMLATKSPSDSGVSHIEN